MIRYRNDIKPYKKNFLLATVLFLAVSTVFSLQERERRILEIKRQELVRAKEGQSRIQAAIRDRRNALALLKSQFAEDTTRISPSRLIYLRVDEIKARNKPDDMVIGSIEKNGADVSLKYTLSFSNIDFSALLNTINQLQRNIFPFTPVESVTISQGENMGRGFVLNVINGRIISFEVSKP